MYRVLCCLTWCLFVTYTHGNNADDVQALIEGKLNAIEKLWNEGKANEIVKYYAKDVIYMANDVETKANKNELAGFFADENHVAGDVEFTLRDFEMLSADTAITISNGVLHKKDGSVMRRGRTMVVWENIGGDYVIVYQIDNDDENGQQAQLSGGSGGNKKGGKGKKKSGRK